MVIVEKKKGYPPPYTPTHTPTHTPIKKGGTIS